MAYTADTKKLTAEDNSNPVTDTYTVGATGTLLVLCITVDGGSRTGGAPTYNSVELTQAGSTVTSAEGSAEIWYLLAPTVSSSLTVSVPNSGTRNIQVQISSYIASGGVSRFQKTAEISTQVSANASLAVTPDFQPNVIVQAMFSGNTAVPSANSDILIFSNDTGQESNGAQYKLTTATSSQTLSWTTNSDDWCAINAVFDEQKPPTVALNTPADSATGVDTEPDLLFTGTDVESDEIEYRVQVDPANTFDSSEGSPVITDTYSESTQDSLTSIDTTTRSAVGQSFDPSIGGILDSAKWFLRINLGSPTGNAFAKIYTHSGTYGTSSVPTGAALATSDAFDMSTLTGSFVLITFNFTGADRISLTAGTKYVVSIESSDLDTSNRIEAGRDGSSPAHSGNWSDLQVSTWASATTVDNCFYVYVAPGGPLLDKFSVTPDATFAGTGDPHPWPSGNQITYTVQAGDILTDSTEYFWRVRGADPLGSNSFGAWSTTRSFTTTGGGASKIKTVDTIAIASVKTISGIAIASVKTRDTISNV